MLIKFLWVWRRMKKDRLRQMYSRNIKQSQWILWKIKFSSSMLKILMKHWGFLLDERNFQEKKDSLVVTSGSPLSSLNLDLLSTVQITFSRWFVDYGWGMGHRILHRLVIRKDNFEVYKMSLMFENAIVFLSKNIVKLWQTYFRCFCTRPLVWSKGHLMLRSAYFSDPSFINANGSDDHCQYILTQPVN